MRLASTLHVERRNVSRLAAENGSFSGGGICRERWFDFAFLIAL
jgi:hypothetical protein